ncbi:unnamed protein product [Adineta ricciae]|uniref:Tc1-like transposase DDE domain-containing protein n=1 Tax=Adineta ricciae TaxID=249248 RepID=A0A815SIG5_ADIRI|nr:unnamed protein product [Adineta ricciae]
MGETSVKNLRSRTIVYSTLKRQQYSTSNAPAKILCRRHTASSTYPSTNHVDHLVPQALFPEKQMHSGRPNIVLSEQGKDLSRVKFDKLVQEKVYPTLEKLLKRLTEQYADFPIYSTSTLCKKNEEPWFRIPTNIKDKNCIGFTSFCCDKREIFQILEEFRKDNVYLYYHDETWINLREVKRSIWTLNGEGEIKKKWTEELVDANCSPKEYISDQIGKKYDIEIFRLPKLHCSPNPIELSWNNLKQFVHDQNITFRQENVKQLIEQLMLAMDDKRATSYFHHVHEIEEMYKTADAIMEEYIEPQLQSDSEETDSDDE